MLPETARFTSTPKLIETIQSLTLIHIVGEKIADDVAAGHSMSKVGGGFHANAQFLSAAVKYLAAGEKHLPYYERSDAQTSSMLTMASTPAGIVLGCHDVMAVGSRYDPLGVGGAYVERPPLQQPAPPPSTALAVKDGPVTRADVAEIVEEAVKPILSSVAHSAGVLRTQLGEMATAEQQHASNKAMMSVQPAAQPPHMAPPWYIPVPYTYQGLQPPRVSFAPPQQLGPTDAQLSLAQQGLAVDGTVMQAIRNPPTRPSGGAAARGARAPNRAAQRVGNIPQKKYKRFAHTKWHDIDAPVREHLTATQNVSEHTWHEACALPCPLCVPSDHDFGHCQKVWAATNAGRAFHTEAKAAERVAKLYSDKRIGKALTVAELNALLYASESLHGDSLARFEDECDQCQPDDDGLALIQALCAVTDTTLTGGAEDAT